MRLPFRGMAVFINPAITSGSGVCIEVSITNEAQRAYCERNEIPLVQLSKGVVARVYLTSKGTKGFTKRDVERAVKEAKTILNLK